jgi:hypothetical protein
VLAALLVIALPTGDPSGEEFASGPTGGVGVHAPDSTGWSVAGLPPGGVWGTPGSERGAHRTESDAVDRDATRGLEPLVPEVAGHTLSLSPGPRPFGQRLVLTPAFGQLGGQDLYAIRLAYNPSAWLGYEIGIGHNPGRSVHALTHTLSALLRYPVPFRIQPYATAGYGMVLVFPGQSVNADPVTENVFALGGGVETFVRDDVAIRVEAKRLFVPGDDPAGGSAVYEYGEVSVGLSFYRSISN